jgi:transaldolase
MTDNLQALSAAGVSIWLDDLTRERLVSGSPARLAADDHVVGVPNPSITAPAIADSDTYCALIRDLSARGGVDVGEAMRVVTTFDVRWACDVLRPVYDATATGVLLPARPYASGTA